MIRHCLLVLKLNWTESVSEGMQVPESRPVSGLIILPSIILPSKEKTCRFLISPSLALQAWIHPSLALRARSDFFRFVERTT